MNPKRFFAELKRRNVYEVAVAYAVVTWLVVQAASLVLSTFEAPSWVVKVFVTAVALGFPVAIRDDPRFQHLLAGTEQVGPNK